MRMRRTGCLLLLAGMLTAGVARGAQRKNCYVIKSSGERIRGIAVKVVNTKGDLLLNVDGKVKFPFKRGSYRFAFVPKPKEVAALEKAYQGGQYDKVIQYAGRVFDMYKFVGWGDHIAYLEGMSYYKQKKYPEAKQAFQKGAKFQGKHVDELRRGLVRTMLELKETDKVLPVLERMVASPNKEDAAFAFNARGRIFEKNGKKKEAVLEYFKTLLLFDGNAVRPLRDEARGRAVALLKEMKDPRWKDVENME